MEKFKKHVQMRQIAFGRFGQRERQGESPEPNCRLEAIAKRVRTKMAYALIASRPEA